MKKLLLILLLLFVPLLAGLAIFLATFDADQLRPLVVERIQQSLGGRVEVARIGLGWRDGISARIEGVQIYGESPAGEVPAMQVGLLSAKMRFWPLLQRRIQIDAIVLERPVVHIVRNPAGDIRLPGFGDPATPDEPAESPGPDAQEATPGAESASGRSWAGMPMTLQIATLTVRDGTVSWRDETLAQPHEVVLSALDVKVANITPGRPMDIVGQAALGATAPNLRLKGRLTVPDHLQPGSLEDVTLSLDQLPIHAVLPEGQAGEPRVRVSVSGTPHASFPALRGNGILDALTADGDLRLEGLVLEHFNLLREIFGRFSMIPGLVQLLEARLPEPYRSRLTTRDIVFEPAQLRAQIAQGRLVLDELHLQSDTFGITGAGSIDLDGTIELHTVLHLDPTLSGELIRSVEQLGGLMTARGGMGIPVTFRGRLPSVVAVPDLEAIALRVGVSTLLGTFMGDLLRREEPASASEGAGGPLTGQPPADAPQGPEPPTTGELLGDVFRRVLDRALPQDSSQSNPAQSP